MKTSFFAAAALAATALFVPSAHAQSDSASLVIEGGSVSFDAETNLSAIAVHGKSSKLKGRVELQHQDGGILLEHIEAWLPVKDLSTGMGLRDDHMREHVFKTPQGQFPDLRFTAENVACKGDTKKEMTCQIPGQLAIQGRDHAFTIALKIRPGGSTYSATGEGIVKLSDYGIERPSQLGVQVEDAVTLRLNFTGKEVAESASVGAKR